MDEPYEQTRTRLAGDARRNDRDDAADGVANSGRLSIKRPVSTSAFPDREAVPNLASRLMTQFLAKLLRVSIAALLVMAASGCGTAFRSSADEFQRTQPASAWGKAPPSNHRDAERQFALRRLKDPESARFENGVVERWLSPVSQTDPQVVPTWRSVLLVNAKNSFGGYTGPQAWQFFCYDGELIHVSTPSNTYQVRTAPLPPGPIGTSR